MERYEGYDPAGGDQPGENDGAMESYLEDEPPKWLTGRLDRIERRQERFEKRVEDFFGAAGGVEGMRELRRQVSDVGDWVQQRKGAEMVFRVALSLVTVGTFLMALLTYLKR